MKYTIILLLGCFLGSCNMNDDPAMTSDLIQTEPMVLDQAPPATSIISMGTFTSYAHGLSGGAFLSSDNTTGIKNLNLANFTMTQGPDVYVFVSKANNYSKANAVSVARLSNSYSSVSLSIDLDASLDINEYKFILVYCVQYNSLFGYAELK